jgi:hypothetical protein
MEDSHSDTSDNKPVFSLNGFIEEHVVAWILANIAEGPLNPMISPVGYKRIIEEDYFPWEKRKKSKISKDVRLPNACAEHKRKDVSENEYDNVIGQHQRCPIDCVGRREAFKAEQLPLKNDMNVQSTIMKYSLRI